MSRIWAVLVFVGLLQAASPRTEEATVLDYQVTQVLVAADAYDRACHALAQAIAGTRSTSVEVKNCIFTTYRLRTDAYVYESVVDGCRAMRQPPVVTVNTTVQVVLDLNRNRLGICYHRRSDKPPKIYWTSITRTELRLEEKK